MKDEQVQKSIEFLLDFYHKCDGCMYFTNAYERKRNLNPYCYEWVRNIDLMDNYRK